MFNALHTIAKLYHRLRGGRYRSLSPLVTAAIWRHQLGL